MRRMNIVMGIPHPSSGFWNGLRAKNLSRKNDCGLPGNGMQGLGSRI